MNKITGRAFILGRDNFEKISAVEGIRFSDSMKDMFSMFDSKKLSSRERRAAIIEKYQPSKR